MRQLLPYGAQRSRHALALAAVWFVVFQTIGWSAPPTESPDEERAAGKLVTPETDKAVTAGLKWLVEQQHDDGSFGTGDYRGNTAVSGLAGMAMLASGSTPGRGKHGEALNRIVDYLLASAQESGFISYPRAAGHGPMYGHGFATLFLAECYGMSPREELRGALSKAVKLIVNSQNKEGGWRYYPQRDDADVSVTVCQVMALRAARNAGFHVPKQTIDQSLAYLRRAQNPDGGFMYMLDGGQSGFARSAAAVVALYSAGIYDAPEVNKAVEYLDQFRPRGGTAQRETYYEYGHYYAIQVMWQAGGQRWRRWYPAIRDDLIAWQSESGSWSSQICTHYSTSMALCVLQIPNNVLPIFQK